MGGGLALTAGGALLSIALGAADIDIRAVWGALRDFDPGNRLHQVIYELRLPRTIMCVLAGAAFASAGAIMQGITRNPLADPGILGINAGAVFALAVAFVFFKRISYTYLTIFCFCGSALSTALVYLTASARRAKLSPLRLALAGTAVSAMFTAFAEGIALYFQVRQDISFWQAGGVAGSRMEQALLAAPWIAGGLAGALFLSPQITILSLGEETALGLGQKTALVKILGMILVLMLAGAAVAAAGSIAFLGLAAPHIARSMVGADYRYIIPCSMVYGSLFFLIADIGARMVRPPFETPVGFVLAVIGVPYFLYLINKRGSEL
jgi:iron complex transport system permease protein